MSDILVHFVVAINIGVLVMTLAWVLSVRLNFYSFANAIWIYGFSLIALVLSFFGTGWGYRKWIFALMVCCWSLRLGGHLFQQQKKQYPKEDFRYEVLRTQWSENQHWSFITFFLIMGLVMAFLSAPFIFVAANDTAYLALAEWLGFAVWCLSIVGEVVADEQLEKFKAKPENANKVCDVGVWRWIRHPDYFFEVLVWCSFALFASGSPWGWISWLCPLAVLAWRASILISGNHEGFFPWSPKKKLS